jgi:hypothetical protein
VLYQLFSHSVSRLSDCLIPVQNNLQANQPAPFLTTSLSSGGGGGVSSTHTVPSPPSSSLAIVLDKNDNKIVAVHEYACTTQP